MERCPHGYNHRSNCRTCTTGDMRASAAALLALVDETRKQWRSEIRDWREAVRIHIEAANSVRAERDALRAQLDAALAEVAKLVARNMALQECIVDGLGWDGVEPRWRREAEALLAVGIIASRAEAPSADFPGVLAMAGPLPSVGQTAMTLEEAVAAEAKKP